MNILEAKNLSKHFGKFKAVDDISFNMKEGEILGFLGRNGAGKTTTIQMLLGILKPTAGTVSYFGKEFNKKSREEILEQVNFSSTYVDLPWNLRVSENLRFIAELYKIKNRKKRIAEIVEIFKLEDIYKKRVRDLSSGQKTKVNLAKSLINFPRVLLLDEPTASLDPEVAKFVREFLIKEREKFKVSILITSHNMAEVEVLSDRVIFIDKGKIVADDVPDNLAKTIQIAHVNLIVTKDFDKIMKKCRAEQLGCKADGNRITIDMRESEIPKFLSELTKEGIVYDEISIKKPTLEDYFFEVARTNKK